MTKYNRNFGKLDESGNLEYALIPLVIKGENVWTNIPEKYVECGYYPIQKTDMPEKEGHYYTSYYEVVDNVLFQKWEEHEIVEEATEEIVE